MTPFLNDWDVEKHKGPLPYQVCTITDLLPGSIPISSTCYYLHFALYITLIARSIYHCGGSYGADLLGSCRESWGWDWWKMVGANKSYKRLCLYLPQESQLFILFISSVYKWTEVKDIYAEFYLVLSFSCCVFLTSSYCLWFPFHRTSKETGHQLGLLGCWFNKKEE